jgi:hypothetical protein
MSFLTWIRPLQQTPVKVEMQCLRVKMIIAITSLPIKLLEQVCQRRLNIDPPCRSNIDPGRVAEF